MEPPRSRFFRRFSLLTQPLFAWLAKAFGFDKDKCLLPGSLLKLIVGGGSLYFQKRDEYGIIRYLKLLFTKRW